MDYTMSCGEKLVAFVDDEPTFDFGQSGATIKKVKDNSEDLYTFKFRSNQWGESSDEEEECLDF